MCVCVLEKVRDEHSTGEKVEEDVVFLYDRVCMHTGGCVWWWGVWNFSCTQTVLFAVVFGMSLVIISVLLMK